MTDQKESKKKFLVLLLSEIDTNGGNIRQISTNMKRSGQNLNYYYKKLIGVGFVIKRQSYPHAIYQLTEKGREIKKIIAYGDRARILFRCHALQVGFPIEDMGSFQFNPRKTSFVKGWKFQDEKIKDSYGQWNVRIQSTGLMVISCPEKTTDDPESYFGNMYVIAEKAARVYSGSFSMKLGRMKVVRQGHKEVVDSEVLAKLFGRVRTEDVWIDVSEKDEPRVEERQGVNTFENLMKMPELMEFVVKQQAEFSKNLELHLSVLQEIRDAIKRLGK